MPLLSNTLHIGAWNIDCLHSRLLGERTSKLCYSEVADLLKTLDIFCLSETHCGASDNIELEGYHIVHNLRPKSRGATRNFGGLAVGIKTALLKGVSFLPITNSEYMWLKLNKTFFGIPQDIYLCSVYISPQGSSFSHQRDDIFSLIENDLTQFSTLGECMVLGDFNARTSVDADFIVNDSDKYLDVDIAYHVDTPILRNNLDTHLIDSHGKSLLHLCKSGGLRILNGRKLGDLSGHFTCYSHVGQPSVIDYILCHESLMSKVKYVMVHELTPHSIHCLVSCHIQIGRSFTNDTSVTPTTPLSDLPAQFVWNLDSSELWESALQKPEVRLQVQSYLDILTNSDVSVDNMVDTFTDMLNDIGTSAGIRKKQPGSRKIKKKATSHNWYDKDCETVHKQLKSLARCIKKSPLQLSLISDYRSLKKHYSKLLKRKKNVFRSNIFNMLDNLESTNPKAFWDLYHELCGKGQKPINTSITPDQWWNHFQKLMNRNLPHNNAHFDNFINKFWENYHQTHNGVLDFEITTDEVLKAIKALKGKKSPGMDCIRNEMLKSGATVLAPSLVKLFNFIFNTGKFPTSWSLSTLTVIHKKGDKAIPKNYRGIAVSSNLCKLFCLVLHNRLSSFIERNNVIPEEQIGFRKGSRTQDHILVFKSVIDKYLSKLNKLYVCFVDFASAFDTIWRSALIYKLTQVGINGNFIKIIQNMYSSVMFSVKCNTKITEPFSSTVGVKQGCVLSPIFFNIYLSDLPLIFDQSCDPVDFGTTTLNCLMYADDLVIMSQTAHGLQNSLDKLSEYCLKWKLSVNIDKTKVMIFNKSGRLLSNYSFKFDTHDIQLCQEYSYLGIVFTPSGSFTKAIKLLYEKASKAFFKIRTHLYDSSASCGSKLFFSLIRPILCYGCEVWSPYLLKGLNNDNFIKICDKINSETLHVKLCKLILGVHRKASNNAVRGELGSYPLLLFMLSLSLKYWWKLNNDCMFGTKSLVIKALIENRKLQTNNYFTWSNGIKSICNLINQSDVWDKPNILCKSTLTNVVLTQLQHVYSDKWYFCVTNNSPKLRTYCTYKANFEQENYVNFLNKAARSAFCKLRISAHKLMIETGRYVVPKIPPENRLCQVCNLKEVEDEFHFVMRCRLLEQPRQILFSELSDIFDTDNISHDILFKMIMSAKDFDVIQCVKKFVIEANALRFPT